MAEEYTHPVTDQTQGVIQGEYGSDNTEGTKEESGEMREREKNEDARSISDGELILMKAS